MKKILFLLAFAATTIFTVKAQNTLPRFTVYGTQDASSISFGSATLTDVPGATLDTVTMYPRHQQIVVNLTIQDSCNLYLKTLAGCFQNDQFFLYITNPPQNGAIHFLGKFVTSTGLNYIYLNANKHCVIKWWFDGVNWVEVSRNVNY